jgi:hypothetical protein
MESAFAVFVPEYKKNPKAKTAAGKKIYFKNLLGIKIKNYLLTASRLT